ncbi:HAMP domain-containing sensor histidine kinase [Eubacterium ramulus]
MMKKMSLQWRLTCIITLYIAVICGCLTMFVYKNGVYYIDSLQETVDAREDDNENDSDEIYISIPEDKWDEFANDFSLQVYSNKADYKRNSFIISAVLALMGGVVTYFISGHALRPIREFSDKIEEVEAQNLADSRIEENKVKELNQLSISYNRMLTRLSDAFEVQRQFTANAAHELRTPLSLIQVQLDLYNAARHPGNDADTMQTIKMVTEQNDRLNKMVKTLLDMSELQTVGRDEVIAVDALVDEVLADLEPLAQEKNITLVENCKNITMRGSDILIYRMVYNLVENAIKYNHVDGQVIVTAYQEENHVHLSVEDTGSGIPEELKERVFEPFFRVDKSRSRELGGVGLGLALVREIVRVHDGSITVRSNPSGGTVFELQFMHHMYSNIDKSPTLRYS